MRTDLVVDHLKIDFERRQKKNPLFSLRAYARFLDISPAQLSQILSGKRTLSLNMASGIIEKMAISPFQKQRLLVQASRASAQAQENLAQRQLQEDEFQLMGNWESFALLSLAKLKNNQASATWIAQRLQINERAASVVFERLLRMGLIEKTGSRFRRTGLPLKTTQDVASTAIRKFHRSVLEVSQEKLESVPIELRDFSSVTMPADPGKLEEARNILKECRRQIAECLETDKASEVFVLHLSLFPFTQVGDHP